MKIEAENLQTAYLQAAQKLNCSVTELDIKVLQHPSKGILGMFKKTAIIEVSVEKKSNLAKNSSKNGKFNGEKLEQKKQDVQQKSSNATQIKPSRNKNKKLKQEKKEESIQAQDKKESLQKDGQTQPLKEVQKNNKKPRNSERKPRNSETKSTKKPAVAIDGEVIAQIDEGLRKLFGASCFNISSFEVGKFDEQSVYIKIDGEDAALLIGKEGYRYKAISYLIYNWINLKYGLNIRLEIAEFFKNQEAMIVEYLENIVQRVNENGKAHTKPLDGILVKIALEQLRAKFPDKYVGVRTGREGKFVVVNDFHKNNE